MIRLTGRDGPRVKNGPTLAGHGAEAIRDAIASAITTLPEQLRRSLTLDQGAEMSQHTQLRIDTGLPVNFCDPRSPWQRATNGNTNGLLRQYHRPHPPQRRGSRCRRGDAQQPASQDARLENARRGAERVPALERCIDTISAELTATSSHPRRWSVRCPGASPSDGTARSTSRSSLSRSRVRGARLVSQPNALTPSQALLTLTGIAGYDPLRGRLRSTVGDHLAHLIENHFLNY
jgi:hypothetical protein